MPEFPATQILPSKPSMIPQTLSSKRPLSLLYPVKVPDLGSYLNRPAPLVPIQRELSAPSKRDKIWFAAELFLNSWDIFSAIGVTFITPPSPFSNLKSPLVVPSQILSFLSTRTFHILLSTIPFSIKDP